MSFLNDRLKFCANLVSSRFFCGRLCGCCLTREIVCAYLAILGFSRSFVLDPLVMMINSCIIKSCCTKLPNFISPALVGFQDAILILEEGAANKNAPLILSVGASQQISVPISLDGDISGVNITNKVNIPPRIPEGVCPSVNKSYPYLSLHKTHDIVQRLVQC